MSDYEYLTGIITKLMEATDSNCEKVCKKNDWNKKSYHEDWKETLCDEGYRNGYEIIEGFIWETNLVEKDQYEDIYSAIKVEEDKYQLTLKFYNGGCSLSDAIEEALKNYRNS